MVKLKSNPNNPVYPVKKLKRNDTIKNQSILTEFWEFLKYRKRYWLLPIVVMLSLMSAFIVFTQSSAIAPFIYALF